MPLVAFHPQHLLRYSIALSHPDTRMSDNRAMSRLLQSYTIFVPNDELHCPRSRCDSSPNPTAGTTTML